MKATVARLEWREREVGTRKSERLQTLQLQKGIFIPSKSRFCIGLARNWNLQSPFKSEESYISGDHRSKGPV